MKVTCITLPKNSKEDEYIAVGGAMTTTQANAIGRSLDFHVFPFISVYRKNVAQTVYQDYAMSVLRTKVNSSVRKLEILPKVSSGWTYMLVIFDSSIALVRFKDKHFQVIKSNDQFIINPHYVYAINNKCEIVTADANRRFYKISRNSS